jgi:lipopolysaccharide export system protein LptC
MRVSSSAPFPLLILALLAGFTFWLDRASQEEDSGNDAKLRHDMDFWVDRFTLRRFGQDGSIQHALSAKRMEHFPDDESTEVREPNLAYFREGQVTTLTAKTAWLDKEGKHVRLDDDVRVVRNNKDGGAETVITTSVLHVTPDDEVAYTSKPVTITQGQTVVHGTGGLEVDNKTRMAVLSGPVQGTIHRSDK